MWVCAVTLTQGTVSRMPDIDDAIHLAERYASEDSKRTGQVWRAFVEDFELGWAIWTAPPRDVVPEIGSGAVTVMDRDTGELSRWPAWPTERLATAYRQSRGDVQTVNDTSGGVGLPMLASIVTPDGVRWQRQGARLGAEPRHHQLVAQWLAAQPTGALVRGVERHAELLVLSQVLRHREADVLRASEVPSPAGRPCDTCVQTYVHFGLVHEDALVFARPHEGQLETPAVSNPVRWAQLAVDMFATQPGWRYRIAGSDAARAAIERFPVVISSTRKPGQQCRIRPFHLGVTEDLGRYADTLGELAEILEMGLFPLGEEDNGDAVIAIDELGRVFLVDQAGAWYYGTDVDTALRGLTSGIMPQRLGDPHETIDHDSST